MRDACPRDGAALVRTLSSSDSDVFPVRPLAHPNHGVAMGPALGRLKRRITWLTVTMVAFIFFTIYSLTFTCCMVVQSGPVRDDVADEARYQRDLDAYPASQYGAMPHQKKLLDHESQRVYGDDTAVRYDAPYAVRTTDNDDVEEIYDLEEEDPDMTSDEFEFRHPKNVKLNKSNMLRTREEATKKLPRALIIGVKKGGTRALLEFIRIHPDVRAPGPEPHFFDRHYNRGVEWYRNQMPATMEGQITMEKTPSYFVTKGVPGRIYNMAKDIKLIVVVRDPVVRAISDYTQTVSKRPDLKPFDQMAFVNNSAGLVDTSWGAVRIGVYAKHLEKWLKYFPLTQIHFVNGEKLISNPAGEMANVQDFLGLKRVITDKHFFFNTTKGFPCLKKPEGSGSPHCLGKTKGRAHPDVDPKVVARLRDFYRPFNAKFYQMTGIDFGWP